MKKSEALAALGALAQETRLDIYRLLVQAGEDGLAAGKIGEELGLPSATLAFHLKELKYAGLVTFTREGRSLIYAAIYPTMNALLAFLTENCCGAAVVRRCRMPAPRKAGRTPSQQERLNMSDNAMAHGHDQGNGARALRRYRRPRGLAMLRAGGGNLLLRDRRCARLRRQGTRDRLLR